MSQTSTIVTIVVERNLNASFQTYTSKDISVISIFPQNPARQGSEWSS